MLQNYFNDFVFVITLIKGTSNLIKLSEISIESPELAMKQLVRVTFCPLTSGALNGLRFVLFKAYTSPSRR